MVRSGAHNILGAKGEELAAEFLIAKGYKLLARNLVLKIGEIDLLCQNGEVIVVVEVKTQARAIFADPIYKINPTKQRKLRSLARVVAARYPDRNIRIDAVTVYWQKGRSEPIITHLENIL